MNFYMIKPRSSVNKYAKIAFSELSEKGRVEFQAIGMAAVNNAVKAASKAVGMVFLSGKSAAQNVIYGTTESGGKTLDTVRIRITLT